MAETQGYTSKMATAEGLRPSLTAGESSTALASQWRVLTRATTFVALLTSPAAYLWFDREQGWAWYWSALAALGFVIAFRGVSGLALRRFIPWPSLFGIDDARLKEEDLIGRRRAWTWRFLIRVTVVVGGLVTLVYLIQLASHQSVTWWGTFTSTFGGLAHRLGHPGSYLPLVAIFFVYFVFNFLILLGPMLMLGISQIQGFEPGDAEWGVRLEDVRGQAEAKEEVRRVISLWQSGEAFESAGGKRERGLLFHGAPGTGKTMLAKAIATGFNSPFVSIPGSGFAQAQPLDAKILTPRGWTTMGEIEVGDEVIDPEGGTARVIGVFPQGERDIHCVTFSDGSSTECDLDHLWQVRRHRHRPWRVEMLREIKEKLE